MTFYESLWQLFHIYYIKILRLPLHKVLGLCPDLRDWDIMDTDKIYL